ncbi:MAG: hypothetical protein LPK80_09160 [Bacteroidota bacterium]|nr:hypothetical protein [Bacteroidota bacterium]
MIVKFILVFLFSVLVPFLVLLFIWKVGKQFQFLVLKNEGRHCQWTEVFRFSDSERNPLRQQAFMLFPLMFPVILDEDNDALNKIKGRVKQIHISIYFVLIILLLTSIYASKAYPEGIF